MSELTDYITEKIQSNPLPYTVITPLGEYKNTNCICWKLPPPCDEDKSLVQINSELENRLSNLLKTSLDSEEIKVIIEKRNQLLEGVKFTTMFGMQVCTPNDILKMDKRKGIRKEWWKLHQYVEDNRACLFVGYTSSSHTIPDIADELILSPDPDQCNFIRLYNTQGNNYPISTEGIIKRIKKLGEITNIRVLSATFDSLELLFEPSDRRGKTSKVRYHLLKLCPDIEDLSAAISLGRVKIWWD